jgi:hypothetical protein
MSETMLRDGTSTHDPRLGRVAPSDWKHVERYPLRALAPAEQPTQVPVVLGVNWYGAFDQPQRLGSNGQGSWWIGRGALGPRRGGHAICAEFGGGPDSTGWHSFYDQGSEGACVGFAWSRAMSLLNRRRYDAAWLYGAAQRIDEWDGESYAGTSVRAAADILSTLGHRAVRGGRARGERPEEGIAVYRWATSVDEVHAALGDEQADRLGAIPLLNSWGVKYPQRVWLPDETLERLLREDGEAAVPTDR